MNHVGEPLPDKEKLEKIGVAFRNGGFPNLPDFYNTENAFIDKTDARLKKMAWLFRLMNSPVLVEWGAKLALFASRYRLPFFETIVKKTIFQQFCGGTTLLESAATIGKLYEHSIFTVLDYGVEAKENEEDFNATKNEIIRAIDFSAQQVGVRAVSIKITGMARFALLEKAHDPGLLSESEQEEFQRVLKRVDAICNHAAKQNILVFIDAEESWIQKSIDFITARMMKRYNTEKVVVFNTFQMYRTDRLAFLADSYDDARKEGYLLGAKLVRGAYLEKERARAAALGYPSPIHETKLATDYDYNLALRFCIERYEEIACCNASHNLESNRLMATMMIEKKIPLNHPHLMFCQLLGMSDNLTYNLASAGFNAGKYVVYGPIRDVIPFLIRRTQENTSVTGELSRELSLIYKELQRRKIS